MSDDRPTIKAIEAVQCIRSGMDDTQLMRRFNITARGLEHLFEQLVYTGILDRSEILRRMSHSHGSVVVDVDSASLPEPPSAPSRKPRIDAGDAIRCIGEGMDEAGLMRRYNLSARGVGSLLRKLRDAGFIRDDQLPIGGAATQDMVEVDEELSDAPPSNRRSAPEIDIYELHNLVLRGASRQDLMERYDISASQLENLLETLTERGLMTREQVHAKLPPVSRYFELRRRESGEILFSGPAPNFATLVERAVSAMADLSGCDLSGANLARSVLHGARLIGADLSGATLIRCDLSLSRLKGAVLRSADMHGAVLHKANLEAADLSDANLTMAQGSWAFLPRANLAEANLTNADLRGANLAGCDFFESILIGANLKGAYMEGAQLDMARGRT